MKMYETKAVTKKQRVLKSIKCDECKEDISETDIDFYYEVMTSHALWGNDSVDSIEHLDFCSWKCLTDNLGEYFANADRTYRYEIEHVEK